MREVPTFRSDRDTPLSEGIAVLVRSRFDGGWVGGFEIVDTPALDCDPTYRVRRRSDDVVLPANFGPDEVRPAAGSEEADWRAWVRT